MLMEGTGASRKLGPIYDALEHKQYKLADKLAKQGDKIENPDFIVSQKLKLDYGFYISNQIMKPVLQIFALLLDQLSGYNRRRREKVEDTLETLRGTLDGEAYRKKEMDIKCKEAKALLFDEYLRKATNARSGQRSIEGFFGMK